MATFAILAFVTLVAVLAPLAGADSRDLARRGHRPQHPLLADEEPLAA
jgi:hypothetical protein